MITENGTKNGNIKVCIDPQCDAVYHGVDNSTTRCPNCNSRIIKISEKTYREKFIDNFFQYDAEGNLVNPKELGYEIQLDLVL